MRPREFDEGAVIDAVMRTFWHNGYAATSMNDLVEATGLSRSTIYNSFGGKKTLFALALKEYRRVTTENVALISRPGDVRSNLRALLLSIVDNELSDHEGFGCFAANSSLEVSGRDPELSALVAQHFERLESGLLRLLKRGQKAGEISPDQDCQMLSRYFVAVIQGIRVVSKGLPAACRQPYLHSIVEASIETV
ncbi:TetR/AcrR family transcriptional regulator [Leisingera sp. HS039]|uniref:TetR/AcrR family transcriptional regulator n=1 Tax=unclassified Leisingera TaxID=2614906 RepID=UPI001430D15E|nr:MULTISPECIES: TetR/AcrR family transcriptional regulator [unclassified Leisingera]MBQ4826150.1 TetR/AcrR family transcriptional regulator [Leisingera sp. HS039]